MRLAILSTNAWDAFAGSEVLWAELAHHCIREGDEIFVAIPPWKAHPERILRLMESPRHPVTVFPTRLPMAWRIWAHLKGQPVEEWFKRYRREWLLRCKPDMVFISQGCLTDGIEWMEACADLKIAYGTIVHLVTDFLWPSAERIERAVKVYDDAAKIYFVSHDNLKVARRQLGAPLRHAELARNPLNMKRGEVYPWPASPKGDCRLACVGRLGCEHKGQDLLVEVLSDGKWRDRNLTVTLFGQGHHHKMLQRLIRDRALDHLELAGHTNSVGEIWRDHHALVMPSRYEGLPIALVEAFVAGRPAVVTDVGGNRELVEEGVTGYLCEFPSPEAFDRTLERAWSNFAGWQQMGEQAREKITGFLPEDPIADLYKSLRGNQAGMAEGT